MGRKYYQILKRATLKIAIRQIPPQNAAAQKCTDMEVCAAPGQQGKQALVCCCFARDHWVQCSEGREGRQPAAFVCCCVGGPGVLWSAVQGLCCPAASSSSSTDRFPTLHPNKMKSALTLQNVDEFFRVNQPCQPDVELSPTCDII